MEKPEKIWNRRFILLFITNLLVLAAFYASIPIIPIYCQEIGITGARVGMVLTAMSVATILFRPVAATCWTTSTGTGSICCFWPCSACPSRRSSPFRSSAH